MATTVNLPYFATDLPCHLPTDSKIDHAADIFPECMGRRIVGVGQHYVIKFVNLLEEKTFPRVYALYSNSSTGVNYIITERDFVLSTLRNYFTELRQLPSPNYYGSLDLINGPFTSENALIEGMVQKYLRDGGPPYRAEFFHQCLPRVLGGHSPTFTHGDFQRKNIMIQRESGESGHADGPETPRPKLTLIDWEKPGWYPTYWEHCYALTALRWDDDWCLCVEKVTELFIPQALWFRTVRLEMWS
ncbi:hypothetical protein BDV34DRAFT_216276 [Aspergillus parasiticus]|uniref:Aminoglycoside phosphotransferase domain-containing protein n=1 Tax=Aspergillus parasiticus TaxID=5067 RepID=A0A5N6DBL6_ASPPA|nr:hypothetical protein BDV34DRAFT_216276 [Aspergillus parasiticus]